MSTQNKMIEIFNTDGSVSPYIPVAHRLPAFLDKYGPETGYGVHSDVEFKQGQKTRAALFKASLVRLEDGAVVAQASALRLLDNSAVEYRVYESGETAALQRLMARLGFGSDTLLADEQNDMALRGLNVKDSDGHEGGNDQAPEPTPSVESSKQSEAATPKDDKPKQQATTQKKSQPAANAPESTQEPKSEVSEVLLRQIRHMAAVRGIEAPVVTTKAEAKQAMQTLRKTPAEA